MSPKQESFFAKCISAEKNNSENYFLAGFADEKFGTKKYVVLQKAIKPNGEDKKLGLDGIYFEYSGQENSGYNFIEEIELSKKHAAIRLKENAIKGLKTIRISFEADEKKFAKTEKMLKEIFKGTNLLTIKK